MQYLFYNNFGLSLFSPGQGGRSGETTARVSMREDLEHHSNAYMEEKVAKPKMGELSSY